MPMHELPARIFSPTNVFQHGVVALLMLLSMRGHAWAATLVVNDTNDAVDASPGDGVCSTAASKCTLRAAVQESNALAGKDTIVVAAATYVLTLAPSVNDDDSSAVGDLDILDDVDIKGAGVANTIVDGGGTFRVFDCAAGTRAYTLPRLKARISRLTVQHGNADAGGAMQVGCHLELATVKIDENDALDGGGLYAVGNTFEPLLEDGDARIKLTHVNVEDNQALIGVGGLSGDNAVEMEMRDAIFKANSGSFAGAFTVRGASIVDSLFDSNTGLLVATASDLTLESSAFIRNTGNNGMFSVAGTSLVSNTTFSNNMAKYTSALFNTGEMQVDNSSFVGNYATYGGTAGTFTSANSSVSGALANTLFTDNYPNDCFSNAPLVSWGYNLASDATCNLSATGDLPNITGYVAEYTMTFPSTSSEGFTPFHKLAPSSPALDAANPAAVGSSPSACEVDDQRHFSRPAGARGDIGSYEACASAPGAVDLDFDGLADGCDGDDDNDGCADSYDQHPRLANVVAGPVKNFCGGPSTYGAFEGNDSDGDGLLDCEDDDDDDDGKLDGADSCRVDASNMCLRFGTPLCLPTWFECFGGTCNELILKFVSVINPEIVIRIEHFLIVGGDFYFAPLAGQTAKETMAALSKSVETAQVKSISAGSLTASKTLLAANVSMAVAAPTASSGSAYRMEVWTRGRGKIPEQQKAVITEYVPSANVIRSLSAGNVIRIEQPVPEKRALIFSTTWSAGSDPRTIPDLDADSVPDAFDNCRWVKNTDQIDRDRNGQGDACAF